MARKKTVLDYHVVPRAEHGMHELNGHECPCEPRCVLHGEEFRLFLHRTDLIDVTKTTTRPKGLLGPGKVE